MLNHPAPHSILQPSPAQWKKICLGLTALAVVSSQLAPFVFPVQVSAQEVVQDSSEQVQLTAIPPRLGDDLTLRAQPGQTIQTSVKIKNASQVAQSIETLIEDFIISEDGTQPIPVEEDTPSQWSLASWVTLSPLRQVLLPNQTAEINVLIEVPADALPGGRYAMIMHQPIADLTAGGAASGVAQRVGTLVYLVVEGDINEEAYITGVNVPKFQEFGPVAMQFSLDNRSDIHIRPNISIEIKNMLGQTSEELHLETKNIFPYTTRAFDTTWNKSWGFGRYTAIIKAGYGTQGQVTSSKTSFWIIPVRLILAIFVGLTSTVVILMMIRRYFKHRNSAQAEQIKILEEKLNQLENDQTKKFTDEHH